MNLEKFAERANLIGLPELEKVEILVFFLTRQLSLRECPLTEILNAFEALHFSQPNASRLKKKISNSRRFVKATTVGHVRLQAKTVAELHAIFPELSSETEIVATEGLLLPKEIYEGVPSYIGRLSDQVNACYENRIFDGCAVLMRRLLEILLIKTYEKKGIQANIQNADSTYKMLEAIVSDARTNAILALSRNTKDKLNDYRTLGNFAAHKIEFTTRKGDIEKIQLDYRATVEELLHKSELKK